MKKVFSLIALLTLSTVGFAQDVDNFEVGPYEVDYKGSGDYKFRIRKGIDLYEYFGLKRDTIISTSYMDSDPLNKCLQINVSGAVGLRGLKTGNSSSFVWEVDGCYKSRIRNNLYFNAGLSLATLNGKYGEYWNFYDSWDKGSFAETIFEIGIPLSLELCNLDRKKASLYGGIGVVPTFYTGGKDEGGNSKSGVLLAPRIDVGGYLPIGKQIVRIGAFVRYDINCSGGENNIFKKRIGRLYLGTNFGLVI